MLARFSKLCLHFYPKLRFCFLWIFTYGPLLGFVIMQYLLWGVQTPRDITHKTAGERCYGIGSRTLSSKPPGSVFTSRGLCVALPAYLSHFVEREECRKRSAEEKVRVLFLQCFCGVFFSFYLGEGKWSGANSKLSSFTLSLLFHFLPLSFFSVASFIFIPFYFCRI